MTNSVVNRLHTTRVTAVDSAGTLVYDSSSSTSHQHATVIKPDAPRVRKPTGWLYPKPYLFHKEVREGTYGTFSFRNTAWNQYMMFYTGFTWWGVDAEVNAVRISPDAAMLDKAVTKALLKLKNQKFNAGVAFGEAQKTADLVGTTAARIARSYILLKKGRFGEARKVLGLGYKTQPANWLELQYGWRPLLSEVHGALELLRDPRKVSNMVVTVKGVVKEISQGDDILFPDNPQGRRRFKYDCMGGVFVRLDYIPENDLLSHASSLGLTNPAEIAWELLPYSFVVDWFLPIGDWFSVMDAALGFQFLSGSWTEKTEVRAFFDPLPIRNPPGYVYQDNSTTHGTSTYVQKTVNRQVFNSSPLPSFPRFKNPLSLGHMANGLALLTQAFR